MKHIIFHSVVALLMAWSASAEVLVYQFRLATKNIGEGLEFSGSARGYVVWNLADNRLAFLTYWKSGDLHRYAENGGAPLVVTVTGARGRQFTTFSTAGEEGGIYFMELNRGQNAMLKHRTGGTFIFPRTFKGASHSLNTSLGPRLTDTTQTAVYSPARTIAANDSGTSAEDVLAGLRSELETQGYVNVNSRLSAGREGSTSVTRPVDSGVFAPAPAGSLVSTNAP